MAGAAAERSRSGLRSILFSIVLGLFVWAFAEAGAFLVFLKLDGQRFSHDRILAEMHAAMRAGADLDADLPVRADDRWQPLEAQVVHPYLGYVFDPTHFRSSADERQRKSDWGYADVASPLREPASDRLVVGILGGSLARQFAQVAPDLLAAELADSELLAGKQLDVVRLAVDGHKQPQQLMTLSYLLALGAHFDLLLNIDGFNEVTLHPAHNAPQGVFMAFPRGWRTRVQTLPDPETLRAIGEIRFSEATRREWARRFAETPLRHSILADLIWRVRDSRLQADIGAARESLRNARPEELRYVEAGPTRRYADDAEMRADLVRLWSQSSLQLDRLARANGIRYFHFLQPNQYVAGSKPMGAQEAAVALSENSPYRAAAEAGYPELIRAGQALSDAGVRFDDLTGIFRDVEPPVYRDDCCHLNPLGNRILAAEIARFLEEPSE